MEFAYKITVFTPTYNRAYTLEALYHSLQRQTFHDFEWLIVDDGSTDGTEELVNKWQAEENPFPVRYVWQENGGKCCAINHGLELAAGELPAGNRSCPKTGNSAPFPAIWAPPRGRRPTRPCRDPIMTAPRWTVTAW